MSLTARLGKTYSTSCSEVLSHTGLVGDRHLSWRPCFLSHLMGELSTLFSPLCSPVLLPKEKGVILDSRPVCVTHRSQAETEITGSSRANPSFAEDTDSGQTSRPESGTERDFPSSALTVAS